MNYQNYELIDFLADEEFKQWVLGTDAQRDVFWQSWLIANPDKKQTVLEAMEIILSLKFRHTEPMEERYEDALGHILNAERTNKKIKKREHAIGSRSYIFTKVAAAILFVITVGTVIYLANRNGQMGPVGLTATITKINPAGQKLTFTLPDGSKVTLNAESTVSFPEIFTDTSRWVNLEGEAYFEVAPDQNRPFTVQTGEILTTALGTSFNIRSFPEEAEINVSLATGKVKIAQKKRSKSEEMILFPGEQLTYHLQSGTLTKSQFDLDETLGWKDGILILDDVDLDQFVRVLERWYGVKFKVLGEKHEVWHIAGKFDNESLEEIMDGLSFAYNVNYTIEGKIVKLNL